MGCPLESSWLFLNTIFRREYFSVIVGHNGCLFDRWLSLGNLLVDVTIACKGPAHHSIFPLCCTKSPTVQTARISENHRQMTALVDILTQELLGILRGFLRILEDSFIVSRSWIDFLGILSKFFEIRFNCNKKHQFPTDKQQFNLIHQRYTSG